MCTEQTKVNPSSDGSVCVDSAKPCIDRNTVKYPWTDEDCAKCSPTLPFAKSDTNSCVAATKSCINRVTATDPWTDADCLKCSPS